MRLTPTASIAILLSHLQVAQADERLRITDEPLELTIHMHWSQAQSYNETYPVELEASRITGIRLVDRTIGSDTKNFDKMSERLLAQSDIPDIVGGQRIRELANRYGPDGAFLPLDNLIDVHAPHIRAFLDKRPALAKAMRAWDGRTYYIPYFPDGKFGRAYFIRQDWLDRLGLDRPQNVEELYKVLVAFRDGDPNGNGERDEIPIFQRHWQELIRLVTLWGGRSSGSDIYHDFLVEDGQVTHPYVEPGYRDGILHLAKWFAEGLIDPEIFERGAKARDQLLHANLGGMTHDWLASTAGYNAALRDDIDGFAFLPFLPPAGIDGKRIAEHRRAPIKPDGWAIGHRNAHPVETIQYFDFWFTEEGRRLANFGIEGQQYSLVDGLPEFITDILASDKPVNRQLYEIGAQIPRGFAQDYRYEIQWTSPEAIAGIALYDKHDLLPEPFLGVSLNEDEQAEHDFLWPSLRSYMLKQQKRWILGESDISTDWQNYLATLEEMGLSALMTAMNSAYTRQRRQ